MQSIPVTRQFELACQKQNRPAVLFAAFMGGLVPLMVGVVSHMLPSIFAWESPVFWSFFVMCVGGCLFSFKSVFHWGALVFGDKGKAAGFAILLEGMLVMSGMIDVLLISILGYIAGGYLVIINAVSCSTTIITNSREFSRAMRAEASQNKRKVRKATVPSTVPSA